MRYTRPYNKDHKLLMWKFYGERQPTLLIGFA